MHASCPNEARIPRGRDPTGRVPMQQIVLFELWAGIDRWLSDVLSVFGECEVPVIAPRNSTVPIQHFAARVGCSMQLSCGTQRPAGTPTQQTARTYLGLARGMKPKLRSGAA